MTDFKNIPIKSISPDPNQPRKFFDEGALQELTDSVKANGILQPILVRPNTKNNFLLVCGERRYRAAQSAGLKEVPAVIRELTDKEALELQIIENLQRKDVHPMEEAVAFKGLLEHKQFSVHEIASRVGKSDFYVRQRLKLNDLSKDWQQAFFRNALNLTDAMQVCQLPVKVQDALYKEEKDRLKSTDYKLSGWKLDQYKGDLHRATFDLTDAILDKKAGACTSCQHNTAVSLLFPDQAQSPRCMNSTCFRNKSDVHFDRALEGALEDPQVILVTTLYQDKSDVVKKLKASGHSVLKSYDDYREIAAPEKPDFAELKESYEYELEEGEKSMEDIQQEYEELLAQYEIELGIYNKKVDSAKYKRAFVVGGQSSDIGKYIYVELKEKAELKASKAAVDSGIGATTQDYDQEIARLQERDKRSGELAVVNSHLAVLDQLKDREEFTKPALPMHLIDRGIMVFLLLDSAGYTAQDEIRKAIKNFPKDPDERYKYQVGYFESLSKVTDEQLAFIIRKLARDKWGLNNRNFQYGTNTCDTTMLIIAEYLGVDIKEIFDAQAEAANKRKAKVDKRIAELEAQKAELKPKKGKKSTKGDPGSGTSGTLAKSISSLLNKDKQ